jgi:AAA domain
MSLFVIVSGLPASGKSTLAQRLAERLELPWLDKDVILEALFDGLGTGDREWRKRLSRAADEVLRRQALRLQGAVITSWWRHPSSGSESGTDTQWLSQLPGPMVELHCVCRAELAAERFVSRRRHAGHLDAEKSFHEILTSFEEQALLGPLGIGPLVEVPTEIFPELSQVATAVFSALSANHPSQTAI